MELTYTPDRFINQHIYDQLLRFSQTLLRMETRNAPFQAHDLLHEACVRLVRPTNPIRFVDQNHFQTIAARTIRRTMIDLLRSSRAGKREGNLRRVPIDSESIHYHDGTAESLAVSQVLDRLASRQQRQSQVVKLRVFGAASLDEIAEELRVSTRTVRRDWAAACDWLCNEWR